MPTTSVIIPARGEGEVLARTVADVYAKATGDIECLVGFDGPPYQRLPEYPGLAVIHLPETIGLKAMINKLAHLARGRYLFKTDAHCMFAEGFDETLAADMQDNWVVTPRFYVLDAERWAWQDERFYDYFYLSCPFADKRGFRFKAGGHWPQRTAERLHIDLDETPQIHGSGWFVSRDYFLDDLGGFPATDPFGHAQEPPYLGLKTWLGPWGGRVMVNKKTWYAHMHQQGDKRGYHMGKRNEENTYRQVAEYWMGNEWEGREHDMHWFLEKFEPMPTWPAGWRTLYADWLIERMMVA
jgi:hypothetical protein